MKGGTKAAEQRMNASRIAVAAAAATAKDDRGLDSGGDDGAARAFQKCSIRK